MNYKTIVYPFDRNFLPILRSKQYPLDIEIVGLVAPEGWGFAGFDAGAIDFGAALDIEVTSNFQQQLASCDTVLFVEIDHSTETLPDIKDSINLAIDAQKNIFCTYPLSQTDTEEISEKCKANRLEFRNYRNEQDSGAKGELSYRSKKIFELDVPVLMCFGLMEQVDKFQTQLSFLNFFREKGYKTELVSSRNLGRFIGANSMPSFMFDNGMSDEEKVYNFNGYIVDLCIRTKPDMLIIGAPGGLIPTNRSLSNRFGICPFLITRAVIPDISVVCLPYEDFKDEYFKEFDLMMKYRFSSENNFYSVSNLVLDYLSRAVPDEHSILHARQCSLKSINSYKNRVFHITERDALMEAVFEGFIENAAYSVL